MEGITFHTLRHSQGSWLSAAGENATDIAARLGHSDPAFTLRRYVHADRKRLAEAPAALEALRQRARKPAKGTRNKNPRQPGELSTLIYVGDMAQGDPRIARVLVRSSRCTEWDLGIASDHVNGRSGIRP